MKKTSLLLSLFALGAMTAYADYTEYYKVYYNGQEVKNGETIYMAPHSEMDFGGEKIYSYEANLDFVNQTEDWISMWANILYTGLPTQQEAESDIDKWGSCTLCFANGGVDGSDNNCVVPPFVEIMPDETYTGFQWQVHLAMAAETTVSRYQLKTIACYGEPSDIDKNDPSEYEMEDGEFVVTIEFNPDPQAAVGINVADPSKAEYYTLQGVRVSQPEKGIYIVKRGNKVTKEFVR